MSEPWNLLDFGILAIFVTSFTARWMAFWHAHAAQLYVDVRYTDLANVTLPAEVQYFQLGSSTFFIMRSIVLHLHLHLGRLADAFIQSDLQ